MNHARDRGLRQTRILTLSLALLFLVAGTALPPGIDSLSPLAPLAQEQPGEDLYLDYEDDVTRTLYANDSSELFQTYVFRLHVPSGSQVSIWLGEDAQGGCYSEGLLFEDGAQVGYTTVGPEPGSWSEPIAKYVNSGYAQLAFRAYDWCESWVSFPVEKYVRILVEYAGEVVIPPPQIDFWADREQILRGECTNLHWRTEYVQEVYYQGVGVVGDGDREECPRQTSTYELYVVYQTAEGPADETRSITIYVPTPTPTRTPTRTHTPTPRPPTRTHTPTPRTPTATNPPTQAPTVATPTTTTEAPPATLPPSPMPVATPMPTAAPRTIAPTAPPKVAPPWVLVVTHSAVLEAEAPFPSPLGAWNSIEGWLRERYGWDRVDVLDLAHTTANRAFWPDVDWAIHNRVQTYTALPAYLLIVGGPEVVTFGAVPNPLCTPDGRCECTSDGVCDYDIVLTDDVYGDFDGNNLPDVPTARLPDGGDFELYNVQFSLPSGRTRSGWGSAMVVAMEPRSYGRDFAELLGGSLAWSPPVDLDINSFPSIAVGQNAYFVLHGSGSDPSTWWGENRTPYCSERPTLGGGMVWWCESEDPTGWNANWASGARSQGTVISGACYGAFIGFPRAWNPDGTVLTWPVPVADSIALTYMRHGAEAFIGHTTIAYGISAAYRPSKCLPWPLHKVCRWERRRVEEWPLDDGSQAIEWSTFSEIANGTHPLDAFFQAKYVLANSLGPDRASMNWERKALHSFVYYGLPPAPTRIEF